MMDRKDKSKNVILSENSSIVVTDFLAENNILVSLPPEPKLGHELQIVIELVNDRRDCDVRIDFTKADVISSPSLTKLLKLRRSLIAYGHKVLLHNVNTTIRKDLEKTGFKGLFEFIDDDLTKENEGKLAKLVAEQDDSAAKEKLIRNNLRLVVKIAREYVGQGMSLGDLIEEGNLGLLSAVDTFDPSHETEFSSHAIWHITYNIQKALGQQQPPKQESQLRGGDTQKKETQKSVSNDAVLTSELPASGKEAKMQWRFLSKCVSLIDRKIRGTVELSKSDKAPQEIIGESELSDDQFEFLMAIDKYKRTNARPFPTWTEVFEIVKSLGYRKVDQQSLIVRQAKSDTIQKIRIDICLADDVTYGEVTSLLISLEKLHSALVGTPPKLDYLDIFGKSGRYMSTKKT